MNQVEIVLFAGLGCTIMATSIVSIRQWLISKALEKAFTQIGAMLNHLHEHIGDLDSKVAKEND
jgi:hypothetical protein